MSEFPQPPHSQQPVHYAPQSAPSFDPQQLEGLTQMSQNVGQLLSQNPELIQQVGNLYAAYSGGGSGGNAAQNNVNRNGDADREDDMHRNNQQNDMHNSDMNMNSNASGQGGRDGSGHHRAFTDIVGAALERDDVSSWMSPYMQVFTVGGGVGFASGMVTKRMGKVVLKTTIGSLLIIQVLHYRGYLTINWQHMKNDINDYMANKEGSSYMQFLVANIGSVLAGFGLGFSLG